MKNMFKKVICAGLIGLLVLGNTCNTVEAEIIQKGNKTFITMDTIEKSQNLEVIKYFKIKNAKVRFKNNTYTVEFNSKDNCKNTKKLVKKLALKLHGNNIEKLFNEYRCYNIKVVAKMKNGNHIHSYYIKGHKIIK